MQIFHDAVVDADATVVAVVVVAAAAVPVPTGNWSLVCRASGTKCSTFFISTRAKLHF